MRAAAAVCCSEPRSELIAEELMKQKAQQHAPPFNLLRRRSIIKLQRWVMNGILLFGRSV